MKANNIIIGLAVLAYTSCKTPQATIVPDRIKQTLPQKYEGTVDSIKHSAVLTPWRQFFTDSKLVSLIDTALVNNQDLIMTLQQIEMAKSDVLSSQGRLLPSVSLGGSIGVDKVGRYTSEGAGNASTDIKPGKAMPDPLMNYTGGLQADWEVDLWNKLKDGKKAAVENYLATVEGKNAVLSTLIATVAEKYDNLLCLDNQLKVIQQYIELQKKALELSKIQKQANAGTELGVKKFEAELAKARSTEFALKQQIVETENGLNLLLGRYPTLIDRSSSTFMESVPQIITSGFPSELIFNRPDVRQAEHQLAATKWNVEAARKEFLPSLHISGTLGLDAFNPTYLTHLPQSLAFSLMGGITGPLINKKAIQANFNNANAQQIEALYQYDKTLLSAYIEVCTLMEKNKNLNEYYKLKQTEKKTLDESVDIANKLYLSGGADYLDVLMDQRDALDATMDLLDAKQQQLINIVYLYKSLGGGWQ